MGARLSLPRKSDEIAWVSRRNRVRRDGQINSGLDRTRTRSTTLCREKFGDMLKSTGILVKQMSSGKTDTAFERRVAQLLEQFDRDYSSYQYSLVNFVAEHLTDLSRSFDGDFQQVMLVAIMGQRRMHSLRNTGSDGRATRQAMSMTASRLADITGIPRETVRRKLALLKNRGWIDQDPDGSWALVTDQGDADLPVRRDLAELDRRGRERTARLVAALEALDNHPKLT